MSRRDRDTKSICQLVAGRGKMAFYYFDERSLAEQNPGLPFRPASRRAVGVV